MKNASIKHHQIAENNINNGGSYQLTYTTCPEKSYIVKPEDGAIKYDKYDKKHTSKLMTKIMNGKVEKIQI